LPLTVFATLFNYDAIALPCRHHYLTCRCKNVAYLRSVRSVTLYFCAKLLGVILFSLSQV